MCLITSLKKGLIASEDFVCYKQLIFDGNTYKTSFQGKIVMLNTLMKTDETGYEPNTDDDKAEIGQGFIHASIVGYSHYFMYIRDSVIVKCICRKGTEYYIDDDTSTICARELYITDEVISVDDIPMFDRENLLKVFSPVINDVEKDNVCVGDYLLSDKTFVHAKDYDGNGRVIGVVGYINKYGEVIVTALKQKLHEWSEHNKTVKGLKVVDYEDVHKDMNGREHTKNVINSNGYSEEEFPAFAYVNNYETEGTSCGDWYFPSSGELYESIVKNMLKINISLKLLSDTKYVNMIEYDWYWSSAEESETFAWACYTYKKNMDYVRYLKWDMYYVRPLLAIKN